MAEKRDYYEILSIERNASGDEIKRAYRKLAMKYHPDRNPGDTEAEVRFKEAAEAYEVLSDAEKRQRYDQYGHSGLRGTSGYDFSHMDASDIFSMFGDIFGEAFGGGGRRRRRRSGPQQGLSLQTQVDITLTEAFSGVEREIEFTRKDRCETCSGSGLKKGASPRPCVACGGQGQVQQGGGFFRIVTTCPNCEGSGTSIAESDRCDDCHGSGAVPLKRAVKVKIPPGIHDGQSIRVAGEGEPGERGGPPGDLYVQVSVEPHEMFTREGDHLILQMPISFSQAALGGKVEIPTIDGYETITIKRGTQHGDMERLRSKGMPNLRNGHRGDMAVIYQIEIPRKLSKRQEQLLREFAESEDREVMPESKGFFDRIKAYITGE